MKYKLLFIISIIVIIQCTHKEKDYESLNTLYQDVAEILKSKDTSKISKFVSSITPNQESVEVMKANNCNFRGFPGDIPIKKELFNEAKLNYTNKMMQVKRSLIYRYGNLDSLQFVGFRKEPKPQKINIRECKCDDILIEAPSGIYVFKNTGDSIQIKIGEMLKINGEWKTFTGIKMILINYKEKDRR